MPVVRHETRIGASREAVFALFYEVETFARYSDVIETIDRLDERRYLWKVRVAGIPLTFDIELTEFVPPESFAWRSVSGVTNRGCYRLVPDGDGTRIHLTLDYSLGSRALEGAVQLAAEPVLRKLSQDLIRELECRLNTNRPCR